MSSIRARLLTTILSLALLGALSIVLGARWMSGDLTGLALDREVKNAQFQLKAEISSMIFAKSATVALPTDRCVVVTLNNSL